LLVAACDQQGGSGGNGSAAARRSESGTRHGSAGGFSATLSAELAKQGVEPAAVAGAPAAKPAVPTGSAATTGGSAAATGGSAAAVAAANTPSPGNTQATNTATANTATVNTTTTNAAIANKTAASSGANGVAPATPAANNATPTNTAKAGAPPTPASDNRTPVKPSAELAAIKFDLEPNWDRDLGEAGTFSLVVKVPSTNEQRVFSVHYGYEDQAAPPDCDGYRKFLDDKKVMTVTLNRQRGAACYIEGNQGGVAVFRYLLTYGGKRLMCSGSLYKDPASASLGDLRDKVLMQAKKICETLAL
jgi:hypothetical protein